MDITVTIAVTITRTDGTATATSETTTNHFGDNPTFEATNASAAIQRTTDRMPYGINTIQERSEPATYEAWRDATAGARIINIHRDGCDCIKRPSMYNLNHVITWHNPDAPASHCARYYTDHTISTADCTR